MNKFIFLNKSNIARLPKAPGVYIFKKGKEFLYIGKAVNLKERTKSHFQQLNYKDRAIIKQNPKIGYAETDSEIEALILEAKLIKKYRPKYNVVWRDDKNYFFVGVTKEEFPRLFITRQPDKQNVPIKNEPQYAGPFVSGDALKQSLKILRKFFPYRTCGFLPRQRPIKTGLPRQRLIKTSLHRRPCVWAQLEKCPAPCSLKTERTKQTLKMRAQIRRECRKNVRAVIGILQGNKNSR